MPNAESDRNLLFGILAFQNAFISREALIAAMQAWLFDKAKSLGDILRTQGALDAERYALLEALVRQHLKQHEDDPAKSLEAVSSIESVRDQLKQIADNDLHASLAHVSAARKEEEDPYASRALSSVGTPTSSGLRFRILQPHAKGGLGQVYVAHDEELHREVALKEIQGKYADHPESRARFLLEAEITGGLEHPGIVPVYGLGQYDDGRPFYAMRFIRGDNLQAAITRFHKGEKPNQDPGERALAFRKLLGRFLDVCNAVAYAHSRGVLHRDLKPGNVMLGQYGETLVVDWGLAKLVGAAEPGTASSERPLQPSSASGSAPTEMGRALGTPAYMSPEQAAGHHDRLGPASDVYSLGATLYHLLTGEAPFADEDVGGMLQRVQRGDFPPPRALKPEVSAGLEAVCLKAMALKPEDRYGSARALAEDVEHWLAGEPGAAWREPLVIRTRRWLVRYRLLVLASAAAMLTAATCLAVTARLIMPGRWFTASTFVALLAMGAAVIYLSAANLQARWIKKVALCERERAEDRGTLALDLLWHVVLARFRSVDEFAASSALDPLRSRAGLEELLANLKRRGNGHHG